MKQAGSGKKGAERIVIGAGAAVTVYAALLALEALLIVRGAIGEDAAWGVTLTLAGASALTGAAFAAHGGEKPLMHAAISALAFWGITLLLGVLINGGFALDRCAALGAAALTGGLAAGAPRGKGGRKRRTRRAGK